ncbi:MAG: phytoene desaturase family protein [Lachnospiraceae bacterium]
MGFYREHYQVIIIGGAISGLGCALQLQALGIRDILILEKHNLPGGLATSYVRDGFEMEATLHEMASIGPRENRLTVGEFFDQEGVSIDWMKVPESYHLIVKEDQVNITIHEGIRKIADEIDKDYPGEGNKVFDFLTMCKRVTDGFHAVSSGEKLSNLQLLRRYPDFVRTMGYSTKEVMDKWNFTQPVKDILSAYWIYMGNSFSDLPFLNYCLISMDYYTGGSYVCRGFSHEMSMKMERKAEDNGAQIEFCQEVEKILVRDGKVYGVRTRRGDEIHADYVVSGAYPNRVYAQMIEPASECPAAAIRAVNSTMLSMCPVSVMLILKGTPEELGIHDYNTFSTTSLDTDALFQQGKKRGGWDYLSSICLNLANPGCTPKRYTAFSITFLPLAEAFLDLKEEDYYKVKESLARQMIQSYEEDTGNIIHDKIVEIEVSTPVTISHYVGAWKGTIYGYAHSMSNHMIARVQMAKQDHFIQGLEFANTTGPIGNGMSPAIINGRLAAKNIWTDWKAKEEACAK